MFDVLTRDLAWLCAVAHRRSPACKSQHLRCYSAAIRSASCTVLGAQKTVRAVRQPTRMQTSLPRSTLACLGHYQRHEHDESVGVVCSLVQQMVRLGTEEMQGVQGPIELAAEDASVATSRHACCVRAASSHSCPGRVLAGTADADCPVRSAQQLSTHAVRTPSPAACSLWHRSGRVGFKAQQPGRNIMNLAALATLHFT